MRKLKVFNLLLVLLAFWSSFSFAYDYATCGALTSKNRFSATFSFTTTVDANNQPINPQTVYAERRSNDAQPIAIWSNESISALINDTITRQPGTYTVWLTYEESNNNRGQNKQGQLTFYLLSSGTWEKKAGPVTADFSSFKDIHLGVTGSNINDLQCDTSLTEPEIVTEPPSTFDVCEYFPQPIQSWVTEGTVYSSYGVSTFTANNSNVENIKGWSDNYINDSQNIFEYQPWYGAEKRTALRIGFDSTNNPSTYSASCQGYGCGPKSLNGTPDAIPAYDIDDALFESRKAEAPELLNVSFESTDSLFIQVNNAEDDFSYLCNSKGLCSFSDEGGYFELTILKNLKSLTVQNNFAGKKLNVHLSAGIKIESFSVNGNTAVYFQEQSTSFLGTASIGEWGDTQIYMGNGSVIAIAGDLNDDTSDLKTGENTKFYSLEPTDSSAERHKPVFYGPTANFHIKANGVLEAYLLAKSMLFDVGITVKGSITAHSVTLAGNFNITRDEQDPECWGSSETKDSYTLVLQPKSDIALVCEDLNPALSVISDGVLATNFTGTIVTVVDGVIQNYSVDNGSFSQGLSVSSGGENKTVSVTAYIDGDQANTEVTGSYQFVPYNFKIEDQYVIANKPIQVSVKAQACNTDGSAVDIGYKGTPDVLSEWNHPASNAVGGLTYSPTFSSGQSTSELTLEDSGELLITLIDDDFSCTGDDCPIEGDTLQGQFTVYSRPWTFALCSPTGRSMDGNITDSGSTAFTSAGNPFELYIRPLRWVDGGYDSDPVSGSQDIETSSYCGSPVTQNFFSSDSALSANVVLTHSVAQPSGGTEGTLSGTVTHSNTEGTNNTYLSFSELSWSEVGVLRVNADTQADYLSMNVNLGYRDIGRFYPAWLSLVSNQWNYADDHDGFMYMDQPVSYDFVVEAQNMQGGATTNYSKFSSDLISNVKLLAVDTGNDNEELSDRVEDYALQIWDDRSDWSGAQLQVNEQEFKLSRSHTDSSPLTSEADGPFTDGFGLRVTTKVDGVDFNTALGTNLELNRSGTVVDTGKPFPDEQPDIRYGRMVMEDVGGTSVSTIHIPLRTEYWNGSRFVTNSDDSGSHFVTLDDYVCRQSVWSDSETSSTAGLQGADTLSGQKVVDGVSDELSATPHSENDSDALREQIRFWLRLDDSSTTSPQISESDVICGSSYTSQPWLQYNWRGVGDEDPSAVVTFGLYRGNDRIIFRGEPNLTGQ